MSSHEAFAERIREHYAALLAGDEAAYAALIHEDFVQEWPQSGGRIAWTAQPA